MVTLRLISLLRSCQTVFQSRCTSLHSHQQCVMVLISPHPRQHLLTLSHNSDSTGCDLMSPYVLICIFLIADDAEHLFLCLLVICISSLKKCLFRSIAHFLIGLFVLLLLSCKLYINIYLTRYMICKTFLLYSGFSLSFFKNFLTFYFILEYN